MELKLEAIGDDFVHLNRFWTGMFREVGGHALARWFDCKPRRPWVAEIVGLEPSGRLRLEWQRGRKDYRHANSVGSRGVYVWYTLRKGRVYWVQDLITWKRTERYFCRIQKDEVVTMTLEQVRACLNGRSVLMS